MKLDKDKIQKYSSIIGIFISIVAMAISCEGYNLSSEQYNNSKISIYRGEVYKNDQLMKIYIYN